MVAALLNGWKTQETNVSSMFYCVQCIQVIDQIIEWVWCKHIHVAIWWEINKLSVEKLTTKLNTNSIACYLILPWYRFHRNKAIKMYEYTFWMLCKNSIKIILKVLCRKNTSKYSNESNDCIQPKTFFPSHCPFKCKFPFNQIFPPKFNFKAHIYLPKNTNESFHLHKRPHENPPHNKPHSQFCKL